MLLAVLVDVVGVVSALAVLVGSLCVFACCCSLVAVTCSCCLVDVVGVVGVVAVLVGSLCVFTCCCYLVVVTCSCCFG